MEGKLEKRKNLCSESIKFLIFHLEVTMNQRRKHALSILLIFSMVFSIVSQSVTPILALDSLEVQGTTSSDDIEEVNTASTASNILDNTDNDFSENKSTLEISNQNIDEKAEVETAEDLVSPLELSQEDFQVLRADNASSYPSEADGSKIENISVSWITEDSEADNNPAELNQLWRDNYSKIVRMKLNFALSGQHDYPEGSVSITVPKNIFKDRNENNAGHMTLAVPEAPDRSVLFAYVDNGDSYTFVNTKKMAAASSGVIEMSIRGLTPSEIKDKATGYKSDNFNAEITVNTKNGTEIRKTSNDIYAVIDTDARISGAYKRGHKVREIYPSSFPAELRPENSDDYVFVDFDVHAYSNANQYYSVVIKDEASMSTGKTPIVLGYKNSKTGQIVKGNGSSVLEDEIFDGYLLDGQNFFATVYVAYPNEGMTSKDGEGNNNLYHLKNKVTYTMTSRDDELVTTTSANAEVNYAPIIFESPEGHFYVEKYGLGPYNYALNELRDGKEVDTEYRIYSKAFGLKWTRPLDSDKDDLTNYGKVPYTMTTTDDRTFFSNDPDDLTVEDFEFKSLRIPMLDVYDYEKYTEDAYGFYESERGVIDYDLIYEGYYGYIRTKDYSTFPKLTIRGSKNGRDYIEYAIVDFSTGEVVISPKNGASVEGNNLIFPEGITDFKQEMTTTKAVVLYNIYPTITLKPSERILKNVNYLFAKNDTPLTYAYNEAGLDVNLYEKDVHINRMRGRVTLASFAYGSKLSKSLAYENDVKNRNVLLQYNSTYKLQTNLQSKTDIQEVVDKGLFEEQKQAIWYDLLPVGVIPNSRSVRVSSGEVVNVELIENYKDSNRILMIVTTKLTPSYSYVYSSSFIGQEGYQDSHTLSFTAKYSWENLSDLGDVLNNNIAYQANVNEIGNLTGLKGEPDNPNAGENKYSRDGIVGAGDLMLDFNPDNDSSSFVYARTENTIVVDTYAVTSLQKRVDVNGEGNYGDGLDEELSKNVYENGLYEYRIRIKNTEDTKSTNIRFFDNLENYVPTKDKDDYGDMTWRGYYRGIDVSGLIEKGVKPVVYYSTVKDLVLDDTDNRAHNDLSNTNIWSTKEPVDKKSITAIAIDASKSHDGSEFELAANDSMSFFIKMQAPRLEDIPEAKEEEYSQWYDSKLDFDENEAGLTGGAHAYNNSVMIATNISVETGARSDDLLIRHDYVKVGLKPFNLKIEKTWNDGSNRDGKRVDEVVVQVLENSGFKGKEVKLNLANDFKAELERLPYLDDNAKKINYRLQEILPDGYEMKIVSVEDVADGVVYHIENIHEPEKVSIKGVKFWQDDNINVRPDSILLRLLANGKLIKTQNIRGDKSAESWNYSFENLFKYENGEEIVYTVEEVLPREYYRVQDGLDITNIYYPYGNIELEKAVENSTNATVGQEFTFVFYAETQDAESGETVFDTKEYTYKIYDADENVISEGSIQNGGEFKLKADEKIVIENVSTYSIIRFEEQVPSGYKLENSEELKNISIKSNDTVKFVAKNIYDAKGEVSIRGNKFLENSELKAYQFIFDIYNEEGKIVRSGSNLADGRIIFSSLKYDLEDVDKTYRYAVKERIDENLKGISFDTHVDEFTVSISDNGDGTLKVDVNYDADGLIFHNKYSAEGEIEFKAWKVMKGGFDTEAGKFHFVLNDDLGNEIARGTNDADGLIKFSKVHFTEQDINKTYKYIAKEIAGKDDNIIYDSSEIHYDVEVFDNGDGSLSFDVVTTDQKTDDAGNTAESPIFYNEFKPGELKVKKQIQAGDPNKEFRFKIRFSGDEELLPDGKFELSREKLPEDYKIVFTVAEGEAPNPIVLSKDEGKHSVSLPKGTVWIIGDKWISGGSSLDYEVKADNTSFTDTTISFNEDNILELIAVSPKYSGTHGGVTWGIYENGYLLFRPTNGIEGLLGEISSSYGGSRPWMDYKEEIESIGFLPGVKLDSKSGGMFKGMDVSEINLANLDVTETWTLLNFFRETRVKSKKIDLSVLKSSIIRNMNYMFGETNVEEVSFEGLDLSELNSTQGMFENVSAGSLKLISFDTSKVNRMNSMFMYSEFDSLDLSMLDTSSVEDMGQMFFYARIKKLDISSFDIKNVTYAKNMFVGFKGESITISNKFLNGDEAEIRRITGLPAGVKIINIDNAASSNMSTRAMSSSTRALQPLRAGSTTVKYSGTQGGVSWEIFDYGHLKFRPTNGVEGMFDNMDWNDTKPWGKHNGEITLYAQFEAKNNSLNFVNGEAEFTLHAGEEVSFKDIPAGLSYEIYEELDDGWQLVESSNDSGTVPTNTSVTSTFINTYEAGTTTAQIRAEKRLYGLGKGGFKFQLLENGNVIQTAQSTDSGSVSFAPIVYRSAGTYTYILREIDLGTEGITFDSHDELVKVEVVDDGAGNLSSSIIYDADGAVFNNQTKTADLILKKEVSGSTARDKVFEFEVTIAGVSEIVHLKAGEEKLFTGLKHGTKYSIREINLPAGYTLGSISDNASGTIVGDSEPVVVVAENEYKAVGSVNLEASKVLHGRELKDSEFRFIVVDGDDKTVAEAVNTESGQIQFGAVSVTKAGETVLYIKEIKGSELGMSYDETAKKVVITAVDNGDGTLSASVSYEGGAAIFNNTYTPEDEPGPEPEYGDVSIKKTVLNSTASISNKAYKVQLTLFDKNGVPLIGEYNVFSNGEFSSKINNGGYLSIKGEQVLVVKDLPVGSRVSIREEVPTGFVLEADSNLSAVVQKASISEMILVNRYNPQGSWTPKVTKSLTGKDLSNYRFKFMLLQDGDVLERVENVGSEVLFSDVIYGAEDIGKVYEYVIIENNDRQENIKYSDVVYTVKVSISDDGAGNIIADSDTSDIAFNNEYVVRTIEIPVEKVWEDADDQDGVRPESISVKLLANGEDTGKTLVLNSDNEWKGEFSGLAVSENDEAIVYTVEEVEVGAYTGAITGDQAMGFILTNTHTPETIEIPVEKIWEDADNQDGIRPESITVKLLAGGNDTGKTLVLNVDNDWKGNFTNLDKFADGEEIVYSIEEVEVEGYTSAITGTVAEGFTVTNTHTPETIEIPVEKIWEDADNQDGIRPESITVKLLAGGNDTGKTLVLNVDNEWKGSFTNLDKFADGEEIVYTIEEVEVRGYELEIRGSVEEGFVLINKHTPEPTPTPTSKQETPSKTGERISNSTLLAPLCLMVAAVLIYSRRKNENLENMENMD